MEFTVIKAHKPSDPDSLEGKAGDRLEFEPRETSYPGWIWCRDGQGRESWAPEAWLRTVFEQAPVREAVLGFEIAIQSRNIDLPHHDPADRFIAATALVYDLVLLTADERLLACDQIETMSCQ